MLDPFEADQPVSKSLDRSRFPSHREEFEAVKDELRQRLTLERRQLYVQQWLAALREAADVRDYRDQLAAAAAAAQT